jgi:hypothetical protein
VIPVMSTGRTVTQTSHHLLCDALRGVLHEAVHAGPGALEGIGSIQCQASVVLYLLLRDHPIDQQGRCRSCRRSGAMVGARRQRCRIHLRASYWLLRQPDQAQLLSQLALELGLDTASPPGPGSPPDHSGPTPRARNDPGDTDVPPRIETETLDPPHQTPAVPSPPSPRRDPRAGGPDPALGQIGVPAEGTGHHRVPPQDPPSSTSGRPLLPTKDVTCQR